MYWQPYFRQEGFNNIRFFRKSARTLCEAAKITCKIRDSIADEITSAEAENSLREMISGFAVKICNIDRTYEFSFSYDYRLNDDRRLSDNDGRAHGIPS